MSSPAVGEIATLQWMFRSTQILLWRLIAASALALGIIGIALPVLPTVPLFIVAAWAASKSSPALERRLLAHPAYGPHIRAWRERGIVPRRAKWLATLGMIASAVIMQFTAAAAWAKIGAPLMMASIAIWLWRRPET